MMVLLSGWSRRTASHWGLAKQINPITAMIHPININGLLLPNLFILKYNLFIYLFYDLMFVYMKKLQF